MVRVTGFEPATSCSQDRHSNQSELHPYFFWWERRESNPHFIVSKTTFSAIWNTLPYLRAKIIKERGLNKMTLTLKYGRDNGN